LTRSTPRSGAAGTTAANGSASTTEPTARTSATTAASRTSASRCRTGASGTYIHFILSGALKRAVRWRWIATNPIAQAVPPPQPKPNPQPPTAEQAARILKEAWQDQDWAILIWLTMVTGFRRAELCAIRWRHLDLTAGVLMLERSIGQRSGRTWEKDTKTHQHRRIALDPETLSLLSEYRHRCEERAAAFELHSPTTPSCSPSPSMGPCI
jgi:integrase